MIPQLEKKLSEAAGREVVLWFMEEKTNDITKQVESNSTTTFSLINEGLYVPMGQLSWSGLGISWYYLLEDLMFEPYGEHNI